MKNLLLYLCLVSVFFSCDNSEKIALQQEVATLQKDIAELKANAKPEAGFIHLVYFWLKKDMTEEQTAKFYEGVKTLADCKGVLNFRLGKAAGTPREIVDNTYDAMIVVECADAAGHEAYQVDDIHEKFRQDCGSFFEKIQIYDSLVD